jgi:hypothetical protein
VQRQKDQYQGIWIISPEGKVLAGHHDIKDHKTWHREVLETIDVALAKFGPVEPRRAERVDPLPYRGAGVEPDGGRTLAISTRYLHEGRRDGPVVIDSLTLPARDWAGLLPDNVADGVEWTVPEAVARRFSRVLSPGSDQSTMPHPKDVTQVRIAGKVQEVKDGVARLVYEGKIAAAHTYEGKVSHSRARLTGVSLYDVKAREVRSLVWVFDGSYRHFPPYDSPRETGAAVEWHREPPSK